MGGRDLTKIKKICKNKEVPKLKITWGKIKKNLQFKALEKINPGAGPAIKGFKRYRKEFDQYKERRKKRPRSGGVMMGTGVVRKENWD